MPEKSNSFRRLGLVGCVALAVAPAAWSLTPARGGKNAQPAPASQPAGARGGLSFTDLSGKSYGKADLTAHKASVFLFVSCQCPVSNVYTPRFLHLASDYGKQDVQVFAVYSNVQESLADITRHAKQRGYPFPVIRDAHGLLADRLGAKVTPEAIVTDASGAVRYRGRIDDNAISTKVTEHDLTDALDSVLAGKPVAHPQTAAFGCLIRREKIPVAVAAGTPTYARDVAPILRAKCESCHHPGEVAPFSLQTYQQASAWSADIKRYTQNGYMPPWKPVPGYGDFQQEHQRSLTPKERAVLASWADAGAPQGDLKRLPPPLHFTQGWQLGTPDLILTPAKAYHLAADGDDVYRNFIVDPHFTQDMYVSGVEVRPGNRAVVHHIINYIDGLHVSPALEGKDKDGQPGFTSFGGPGFIPTGALGGWVPGYDPQLLPDGIATKVPKGALIVIQVHYHKDGKPETDLTQIGLHFSRSTVDKLVRSQLLLNFMFKIPPGDPHYEVTASSTITQDCHVLSVLPHMHLLGREMKLWATLPNGTEKPLVWIKDWDFNWQANYALKEPLALPKGTIVHLVAYYDNSDKNPRNPNRLHPRPVRWGEQTTDEMCVAFLSITRDEEHLAVKPSAAPIRAASN